MGYDTSNWDERTRTIAEADGEAAAIDDLTARLENQRIYIDGLMIGADSVRAERDKAREVVDAICKAVDEACDVFDEGKPLMTIGERFNWWASLREALCQIPTRQRLTSAAEQDDEIPDCSIRLPVGPNTSSSRNRK